MSMTSGAAVAAFWVVLHVSRMTAQTPNDSTTVRTSEQVEERPLVIGQSQTAYGRCLREAGLSGRELVHLIVDTTGRVEPSSAVLDEPQEAILDSAALTSARGLIFRPARVAGSAVRVKVTVPLAFEGPTGAATAPDGIVFSLECVDHPPALQRTDPIRYPDVMVTERIGGEALMEFIVDTAGRAEPRSIRVVQSSHRALASVARNALQDARFVPARLDGVLVRCRVRLPFRFRIGRAEPSVATPESRPGELPAVVITAWPS